MFKCYVSDWRSLFFCWIVTLVTSALSIFFFDCYVSSEGALYFLFYCFEVMRAPSFLCLNIYFWLDCYVIDKGALYFLSDCYFSDKRALCPFDCYVCDKRALFFV